MLAVFDDIGNLGVAAAVIFAAGSQKAGAYQYLHAYSSPTISARAFRCDSKGTESSSGTYIAVNFSWEITNLASNNSNAKQYFIQYKTSSATSYTTSVDWTNLSSYSGSMTKVLSQTFSTTSSYMVSNMSAYLPFL